MTRALVTGMAGQDGSYLAELLLRKGYEVYGLVRHEGDNALLQIPMLKDRVHVLYGDICDTDSLERAILVSAPDEIYNLASQSDVGSSFSRQKETMEVNYYGLGKLVRVAMKKKSDARIFQASSSEMFGKTSPPQNEDSSFQPVNPYGEAKLKAHQDFVVGYRQKFNLFICSGFLFNHESPRRSARFVTRKISIGMAKIKLGLQGSFKLGYLDAKRDWSFAGDFVEAMWLMLQEHAPHDYVMASGQSHSVRDFVNRSAAVLGMKLMWDGEGLNEVARDESGTIVVSIDEKYYRPSEPDNLLGDSTRARKSLGWKPKENFDSLVEMMVRSDYEQLT